MLIGLENPLRLPKITVLGHIVHVLLQYKVGATPESENLFDLINSGYTSFRIFFCLGRWSAYFRLHP